MIYGRKAILNFAKHKSRIYMQGVNIKTLKAYSRTKHRNSSNDEQLKSFELGKTNYGEPLHQAISRNNGLLKP